MPAALGRRYVCLVPSPAGRAVTMTRASPAAQPRGRISREPVPAAPDNGAGDSSAVPLRQPGVLGTFRKIKQEIQRGKKKVVRA